MEAEQKREEEEQKEGKDDQMEETLRKVGERVCGRREREMERGRDEETERQRDREIERQREIKKDSRETYDE